MAPPNCAARTAVRWVAGTPTPRPRGGRGRRRGGGAYRASEIRDQGAVDDREGAAVPDGFSEGKTIAVKGTLSSSSGDWILYAKEIQTGCPSKYESAE